MASLSKTQEQTLSSLAWGAALVEAMRKFPTKASFARAVGSPESNVSTWANGARISIDSAKKIEAATGVSKERLRPDVSGADWEMCVRDQILMQTETGRALKNLLDQFGSSVALAKRLGIYNPTTQRWVEKGRVSMRGARLIEAELGIAKESLRPDLSDAEWLCGEPGKELMAEAIPKTPDAKMIAEMVEQFGSTKELAAAAGCLESDIRTWKSRGRIPAIKLPTFLALRK